MQRPGGLRPRPFSGTTMMWLVGASLSLLINNTLLVVSEAFVPPSNICLHGDSSTSSLCNALTTKTPLAKILATRHNVPSASTPRRRCRENVEQWKMAATADDDASFIDATLSIRGGASGGKFKKLSMTKGAGDQQQQQKQQQQRRQLVREMVAELIGTFLLVQIGTGSVMSAVFTDSLVGLFQIASVWIIAVTIAISTTAGISGAHLNPAMSIAFASLRPSKSFGWNKVIPYSLAQVTGAVLASWTNLLLYASTIRAFEASHGIVRASATGIASAKVFGEYFRYEAIAFSCIIVANKFGGRDVRDGRSSD
jgi:5-carboxymethyl-2-hydroxymuconate isomerase